MRKTAAYLVGVLTILQLGYTTMDPALKAVGDWLAPLLGPPLYSMTTLLSLHLVNPLAPTTLIAWIGTGGLIGLIIGRRRGALLTSIIVWVTLLAITAASAAGIYLALDSMGLFEETLTPQEIFPPPPESLTLEDVMGSPLMGPILSKGLQLVENPPQDPQQAAMDLIKPLALYILSKPLILIASSLATSLIPTSRLLNKRSAESLAAIVLLLSLGCSVGLARGLSAEAVVGYASEENWGVAAEVVMSELEPSSPLWLGESCLGLMVATYTVEDPGVFYAFSPEEYYWALPFLKVAPKTLAISLHNTQDQTLAHSESLETITALNQQTELGLQELLVLRIPLQTTESESTMFTAVLYFSPLTWEEAAPRLLGLLGEAEGLGKVLEEATLSPALSHVEMNAVIIVKSKHVLDLLPMPSLPQEFQMVFEQALSDQQLALVGAQLSQWVVDGGEFKLSTLTHLNTTPIFSASKDIGLIAVTTQPGSGTWAKAKLSLPPDHPLLFFLEELSQENGVELTAGPPTPQDLEITLPQTLPEISVEKTWNREGDRIQVTLKVSNEGEKEITHLALRDPFPSVYNLEYIGSPEVTWTSLEPGETVSTQYTVEPENPGCYTDTPALLNFQMGGRKAAVASTTAGSLVKPTNALELLASSYGSALSMLDLVSGGRGWVVHIVPLIFIGVPLLLDLYKFLVRRLKRGPLDRDSPSFGEEHKGSP